MEDLGQRQERFSKMLSDLLFFYEEKGYKVRIGDIFAHDLNPIYDFLIYLDKNDLIPEELHQKLKEAIKTIKSAKHKNNSCHYLKLAADLNLFKGGKYLMEAKDHHAGGEYWESMGGSWGGHFSDGNHYSLKNGIYR